MNRFNAALGGLLAVTAIGTLPSAVSAGSTTGQANVPVISEQAVLEAQKAWSRGILDISAKYHEDANYKARAKEHIDTLYAYDSAAVMFKPTLASEDQFRDTFDEALSYFIGQDGTEDDGFATKGWTDIRWDNHGIYTNDQSAMAMGNYYFTDQTGDEIKVEYTFGYILNDDGSLKINLHHSSLPFSG